MNQRFSTDILIIGSGAAGLSAALRLAPRARVTVLSKGEFDLASSTWAQGGIAAVTDPRDSIEAHIQDTLTAGAGLCDPDIVRFTVENAPAVIGDLVRWGVSFDTEDNHYHLTREGGHSFRRILHVADATGRAVVETLTRQALDHPHIDLLTDRVAID